MRRGAWHQFGDKSQLCAIEQLNNGTGVGVIISPRDLSWTGAINYSKKYHELGAHVLIDQQFFVPDFLNKNLTSYPISQYRKTISLLHDISDSDLSKFATQLEKINRDLSTDGLIAPAVVHEAGRPDINRLNKRLFSVAKQIGDNLGVPTYATIILGNSATSSDQIMYSTLSQATALNSDGWYFGFEFDRERIPSSRRAILRFCKAGITLASTGKPILHAYAGPMALLSLGFGVTGVGIGHRQNLWHFTRGRWGPTATQGGGGNAPARFFSESIWGTIVDPDETSQLNTATRSRVLTHSPFSTPVASSLQWSRWDAGKHLVSVICKTAEKLAVNNNPHAIANDVITSLSDAVALHNRIQNAGLSLSDNTFSYQQNWIDALNALIRDHSLDFDYLDLLM